MEGRLLLSTIPPFADRRHPYLHPAGAPAVSNPNRPILPAGAASKNAAFIDPSARITHGAHVMVGNRTYIASYSTLNASTGFIKIGKGSSILSNATIVSNPSNSRRPTTSVRIGDLVQVGIGATVTGPSTIGANGATAKPTLIGPNAFINGATVQPGAIVGALAYVGPGVTVPSGFRVLPGVSITNGAEASDPSLGKVVPVTTADTNLANQMVANAQALAAGYAAVYQGNSATGNFGAGGVVTAPSSNGTFNGNLATIQGAGAEPGSALVSFEPASGSPTFLAPMGQQQQGLLVDFPARVTGAVDFHQKAGDVANSLGRGDSILGDQGQPITIGSLRKLGNGVTITSPLGSGSGPVVAGGPITIDQDFSADDNAVILGGQGISINIGDNVSVGAGAVLSRTSVGANATIGARSYIENSKIAAGANIAPGTIMINNVVVGTVQS